MNVALFSTFSAVPQGGIRSPDDRDAFTNFYPHPILIEDIVFDWDWTPPTRTSQTYGTGFGDTIRVLLKYANQPCTNGFIPLNLVCPTIDWRTSTPPIVTTGVELHTSMIWKLPNPIWLAPNVPLTVQIFHKNDFTVNVQSVPIDVDVTLRGRRAPDSSRPVVVDLPWATAFMGDVQSTVSAGNTGVAPAVLEQSAQTDLFNPFRVPLAIERFQYQIGVSSSGLDGATIANFAPTDATSAQDQTGALQTSQNYGLDRRNVTVKMTSSRGRALVRDFLPIGSVISATNRAWGSKTILNPQQYFVVFMRSQMPLFQARGTIPFQMRTGISIVGSRRVSMAEVMRTY